LEAELEEMMQTPVKDKVEKHDENSGQKKVQYSLEKFFFGAQMKPAMEEWRLSVLKDDLEKKKHGRPSTASLALAAARKEGEVMVLASLKSLNEAAEKEAERIAAHKESLLQNGGALQQRFSLVEYGVRGSGVLLGLRSNRRLAGAAKKRCEEGAATKNSMVKCMDDKLKEFGSEKDFLEAMCRCYGKTKVEIKKIMAGREEWERRVKTLKLGVGSTGSTAAVGTCSKGGRHLKKGGIGARRQGAGRKNNFKHIQLRVKVWLEKERSVCHHRQDRPCSVLGSYDCELC
jgi:hypothetical protein